MEIEVSRVLDDRYEVGPRIGSGGMAEVHRGYDRTLARTVAIKCFRPGSVASERNRARFEREAQCAASIAHPNAIAVFDAGVDGDTPYIVMECLPGNSLADEVAQGPLPVDRTISVMQQVLAALEAAHEGGVLHRDIKAANVLFAADDRVKLTDFGIARSIDGDDLTETGTIIGTPGYLAPERIAGEAATVQSDVYAAGVLAYEALTGGRPFTGDTPVAVGYAVLHTPVTPLAERRAGIPPHVADAVSRAMARVPEDRFGSAREFADALAAEPLAGDATVPFTPVEPTAVLPVVPVSVPVVLDHRVPRRGLRVPLAILAVLVLVLGFAWLVTRPNDSARPPASPSAPTNSLPAGLQQPFDDLEAAVQP
jgi:serine/threonine-protein kinase